MFRRKALFNAACASRKTRRPSLKCALTGERENSRLHEARSGAMRLSDENEGVETPSSIVLVFNYLYEAQSSGGKLFFASERDLKERFLILA